MNDNFLVIPPDLQKTPEYKGFIHIVSITSEKFTGFQVRCRKPWTSYPKLTKTSLIDAIRDRNAYYRTVGYPPSLLRKPMSESVPDETWESGWRHLYIATDMHRGNPITVLSATVPDLETARRTTRKWRLCDYPSLKVAAEVASVEYNRIIRRYNRIVQLANQLQVDLRLHLAADLELATQVPWLKYQADSDGRIYREAYQRISRMNETINELWKGKGFQVDF